MPLILFLLISSSLFADADPHYFFKAAITTKDKKIITGYFADANLLILYDSMGYYYMDGEIKMRVKTTRNKNKLIVGVMEHHFSNEVKRKLHDSLSFYEDIIFYYGKQDSKNIEITNIPMPIGNALKIDINEVEEIVVLELFRYEMAKTMRTKIQKADKAWVNNQPAFIEGVGGFELCSFTAMCFDSNKKDVVKKLQHLKQLFKDQQAAGMIQPRNDALVQAFDPKIMAEIQRLRRFKILIYDACYC